MRRIVVGAAAALILFMGSGIARAEEGPEIEMGVKWWCNKWKREFSADETVRSERSPLMGPAVEVKFHNNVFVEGSYLMSGWDYKFEVAGETSKFDRRDLDVAAGYMIVRDLGVFAGYRNSVLKEKGTGVKETVYGGLVGVRGGVPLNDRFSLYGSLTYLMNRLKEESGEVLRERNPGWIAEAGAKYSVSKHLAANLGLKYETTKGNETHVKDTFAGWMLGAMYSFE